MPVDLQPVNLMGDRSLKNIPTAVDSETIVALCWELTVI